MSYFGRGHRPYNRRPETNDFEDTVFQNFVSLLFNQVDFATFKQNYESKILSENPSFKELCNTKNSELPRNYLNHEQFAAYWSPFNAIGVLSEMEETSYPENLECSFHSSESDSITSSTTTIVTLRSPFKKRDEITFFRKTIVGFSNQKLANKKSFLNQPIARILDIWFEKRDVSDLEPSIANIKAEMTNCDHETLKSFSEVYLNIVTSFYCQSLHQANLDRMATNTIFLEGFLRPNVYKDELLLYMERMKMSSDYVIDTQGLNEFQERAVRNVLRCMENENLTDVTLIHGPPGTGKTSTIVSILQNVYRRNPRSRVLVCAPSNAATNVIARRIVDNTYFKTQFKKEHFSKPGPLFRLGNPRKIDKELMTFFPRNYGQALGMLANPCLIFSTLNSCQPYFLKDKISQMTFDLIIIDEASQSTEIEVLMPFVYGCKTTVLVGDPKQLQPTVTSQLCANAGYTRSFFERYQTLKDEVKNVSTLRLLIQYRMKEPICAFPSERFYDGLLKTFRGSGDNDRLNIPPTLCYNLQNSYETDRYNSKSNYLEGQFIIELLQNTISGIEKDYSPSIGVICFYKAQVDLIRSMLKNAGLLMTNDIKVNSVDSFQGQEKDVIFVSACRANDRKAIGFAACPNRLNVAITRAKSACYLVVNKPTFEENPLWKEIFAHYSDRDLIITDNRTKIPIKTQALASLAEKGDQIIAKTTQ